METEAKAYMKMCAAIDRGQRQKWNEIRQEMWNISDYLLDRSRCLDYSPDAERLKSLISQLPLFDLDGKGFSRSGTAIEDF